MEKCGKRSDSVNARKNGEKPGLFYGKVEAWSKGGPALPAPSELTQKIIELHTDALKTYQKRKGIV